METAPADTLDLLWPEPEPDRVAPAAAGAPLPRHLVDELAWVASWLDAEAHRLRLVHCDGELASCLPRIPALARAPDDKRLSARSRRPGL